MPPRKQYLVFVPKRERHAAFCDSQSRYIPLANDPSILVVGHSLTKKAATELAMKIRRGQIKV